MTKIKNNIQMKYSKIDEITGNDHWLYTPRSFISLTGDPVQALMTARMVYWCKRSVRRDGFVYKSARDWLMETGVSEHAVRKFKKLPFIETKIVKANGVPTTHYRINTEKLYEALLKIQQEMELLNSPEEDEEECDEDVPLESETMDLTDEPGEYTEWNGGESLVPGEETPDPFDETDGSLTINTTRNTTLNTHNKGCAPSKTPDPDPFSSLEASTRKRHKPKTRSGMNAPDSRQLYQALMEKMSEITGFDPQLAPLQARLRKTVSPLVREAYSCEMLELFFKDWKGKDWRWLKNHQLPTPEQVLQGIGRYKHPTKVYANKWLGQE